MTHDNVTDIVADAQTKWAEIVSNPANWIHLGRKKIDWFNDYGGSLLDEAATLRKQLENAREALRVIAEGDEPRPIGLPWRNDGKPSKHDRCKHGAWMYNGCEECTATFAAEALKGQP